MKSIVFFNNKGGVGKTSLVYHLAWMYSRLGINTIAADLDPQANLTSMFLNESQLENVWPEGEHPKSILGTIRPILRGLGDIGQSHVEVVTKKLGLIPGDLGLSGFEDKLSDAWPKCLDKQEAAFRTISSFYRIIQYAAERQTADLALIDVGPNLGAINRAAMIAAHYVVIPLAPDLYSLQGLRNLGPTLMRWREEWGERIKRNPDKDLSLPEGKMEGIGYVVMQHAVRSDRPVKAYGKWMARIPREYRDSVLAEENIKVPDINNDSHCLAFIKNYRSLMPMAMEVKKPMFNLTPAEGAIGGHMGAVRECFDDIEKLAIKIADHCRISLPS